MTTQSFTMEERVAIEALLSASGASSSIASQSSKLPIQKPMVEIPRGVFYHVGIVSHKYDIYGKILFVSDIIYGTDLIRIETNSLAFTMNYNYNEIFWNYVKKHNLWSVLGT